MQLFALESTVRSQLTALESTVLAQNGPVQQHSESIEGQDKALQLLTAQVYTCVGRSQQQREQSSLLFRTGLLCLCCSESQCSVYPR